MAVRVLFIVLTPQEIRKNIFQLKAKWKERVESLRLNWGQNIVVFMGNAKITTIIEFRDKEPTTFHLRCSVLLPLPLRRSQYLRGSTW